MASWLISCVTRVRTIGTAKMEKRKQPRRGRKLEAFLWLDDRGPPIHTLSVRDGGWLAQFGGSRHGAGTYACMAQALFEFIFPYGKETCIILMNQTPVAVADLHQQAKRRPRSLGLSPVLPLFFPRRTSHCSLPATLDLSSLLVPSRQRRSCCIS